MRLRSAPGPLLLAAALSAAVPVSAVSAAQAHPARSPVRIAARSVARQAREASRAAADVRKVAAFARAHRLPLVTIWAIQRDNGGCPGHVDSDTCSGLRQPAFEFSALLAG
jgi:hypothetical protein